MDSPDLQAKYHKLASEYSKLRAQNQVLKKAVIEEQGRNTQLKDNFKLHDQSLRKAEQENDSLSFRNQQLAKRLLLLQDDLELINKKPRKGEPKQEVQTSSNMIVDNMVYAEELESKIHENARLHAELTELDVFYKNKVSDVEGRLEDVVREAAKASKTVKSQEQTLQNDIRRLENERIMQEVNAQQREAKIASMQNQIFTLKQMHLSEENAKGEESHSEPKADWGPCQKVPPSLPLSLEDKLKKFPDGKVLKDLVDPIKQLSSSFIDFFASYSSLLKQSSTLSSVQLKLADQLNNERGTWQLLSQRYEEMSTGVSEESSVRLESLIGMDVFSKAVANCASSLRKLLPILSEKWLCFKEEQLDAPWRSTLGRLVSCWAAINPYLASLAAHCDGRTTLTTCAIRKILNLLYERVVKLHATSQELVTAWELLNIEDRRQDESTKSALSAIESALGKICVLFCEKVLPSFTDRSPFSSSPSSAPSHSPGTPKLTPHPGLSLLGSPVSHDSSGWTGTVADGFQLADSEASLAQQLAQATSRLSKLEEEREHWRLEYQLLSHRFDKEAKKSQELGEELKLAKSTPKGTHAAVESDSSSAPKNTHPVDSSTSLVGEVLGSWSSAEEREKEIRDHFTNRCSHLYMQFTACTSQAALYQNECETLIRRLAVSEESRVSAEQELDKQRRDAVHIQETLSTTSRNYEEQISTMSDHLADLNEKITSQADSIEQLQFELKKRGKK